MDVKVAVGRVMKYGLNEEYTGKDVPLKSMDVSAQVRGTLVALECTLRYRNELTDPIDHVVFSFPRVDEPMEVVGLDAYFDEKLVRAKVKEFYAPQRSILAKDMSDAHEEKVKVALGQEAPEADRLEVFLGNLGARKHARLVLKLVGELPVDPETGEVKLSFLSVLNLIQGRKRDVLAASAFRIRVWGLEDVLSIDSPTHELQTEAASNHLDVRLRNPALWTKDMVVLIHHKNPHQPKVFVESGLDGENEFMSSPVVTLDFFPKFESTKAASELVFLVRFDQDQSIYWNYINDIQLTLILFLKSIPLGCYFNVIGFGGAAFPVSVPYNQDNLEVALKHARKMFSYTGGHSLLHLLQFILKQELLPGLPRQLFVLTDSSVDSTIFKCIDEVKQRADNVRVFTFDIGFEGATNSIKELAQAGNGSVQVITSGEKIQPKVISTLKKALQPSMTNVELNFSVPTGVEVKQAPSKIPPIFNGDRLVAYAVLKTKARSSSLGPCKAVLSGKMDGLTVKHSIKLCFDNSESRQHSFPFVHHLAAKSLLQDWERICRREIVEKSYKSLADTDKGIIKLSIQSGVAWGCHTAYFGVPRRGPPLARKRTLSVAFSDEDDADEEETAGQTAKKFKAAAPPATLVHLIVLQEAEGYWNLTNKLAEVVNQSLQAIRLKCPSAVEDRVCATAMAMFLLRQRFSDQQDEWELVARKAEKWMLKQTNTNPHSLNMIIQMVERFLP